MKLTVLLSCDTGLVFQWHSGNYKVDIRVDSIFSMPLGSFASFICRV